MGEDQHAAGLRRLDEAERGDGLAGARRVLEPEALGGVGVLGLLAEHLLFVVLVDPVARLLVGFRRGLLGRRLGVVVGRELVVLVLVLLVLVVLVGRRAGHRAELVVLLVVLLVLQLVLVVLGLLLVLLGGRLGGGGLVGGRRLVGAEDVG